jgi:hypothetical protein
VKPNDRGPHVAGVNDQLSMTVLAAFGANRYDLLGACGALRSGFEITSQNAVDFIGEGISE